MPVPPALLLQAPAAPQGGANPSMFIIQIIAIVAIFYFVVIRPQRKQQKQLEASLMAMLKGDEIVTSGGLVGEVVYIKETLKDGKPVPSMADRVTIRTGESKVVVERGRITRVSRPGATG